MNQKTTREDIVEAANQLFYQRGFEHTSFADIADEVKISRGNFYHHFKSKDEILEAVIELRLANTQKLLDHWESEAKGPADCIRSYIHIVIANQTKIKLYGCPVGTLSTELAKLNHSSKAEANQLFTLFRSWLQKQFVALGHMRTFRPSSLLETNSREMKIARLIVELRDRREWTFSAIAKELNQRNLSTRRGCSWTRIGVRHVHTRWKGKL